MEKKVFQDYCNSIKDTQVNIFLKSGTMLRGKIDSFDDFGIIIDKDVSNTFVSLDSIISIVEKSKSVNSK